MYLYYLCVFYMYVSIQTQQGHFYDTFIILDDCNKS